jgi:hypothetical protein
VDALSVVPATFIVGHPRSGTSLLRALLDNHPDLLVLPFETHLFDWIKSEDPVGALLDRTRLWATLNRHRPSISREEVEHVFFRTFSQANDPRARLLALMEGWRELTGVQQNTRWVEKTPRHLYEFNTLSTWFPAGAKVLVMRRDPRDVIASELKRAPSRSIFSMALTGRIAHQVMTEHESDSRVLAISYERLVQDPPGTMQEVCDFLEIPYDAAVSKPTVLGAEYSGNSRFRDTLDGVSEMAIGRYLDVLSGPRLERAEALLSPVLSDGGYAPETPDGGHSHTVEMALISLILRSGLWRSRALRSAFGGA